LFFVLGVMKNSKLEKLKKKVVPVLKKEGVKKAGIFGRYVRGDEKKNSDVDILIEFNGSLLDLVGLEMELKRLLKKKVDLVTYGGLSPYLKDYILEDEVRII